MLCLKCHDHLHLNKCGYKLDIALKLWSQDMLKEEGYAMEEIRKIVGGKLYYIEDLRGKSARIDQAS